MIDKEDVFKRTAIRLDACSPLFSLHAILSKNFIEKTILATSNMLQLTVANRAIVYDLRKPEPIAIIEVAAMQHLLDCQTYVETGIAMMDIKGDKSAGRGGGGAVD